MRWRLSGPSAFCRLTPAEVEGAVQCPCSLSPRYRRGIHPLEGGPRRGYRCPPTLLAPATVLRASRQGWTYGQRNPVTSSRSAPRTSGLFTSAYRSSGETLIVRESGANSSGAISVVMPSADRRRSHHRPGVGGFSSKNQRPVFVAANDIHGIAAPTTIV